MASPWGATYALTHSFWDEILKKLAANLHPSTRYAQFVLLANCRSLVGFGAAEFTAENPSQTLSLSSSSCQWPH